MIQFSNITSNTKDKTSPTWKMDNAWRAREAALSCADKESFYYRSGCWLNEIVRWNKKYSTQYTPHVFHGWTQEMRNVFENEIPLFWESASHLILYGKSNLKEKDSRNERYLGGLVECISLMSQKNKLINPEHEFLRCISDMPSRRDFHNLPKHSSFYYNDFEHDRPVPFHFRRPETMSYENWQATRDLIRAAFITVNYKQSHYLNIHDVPEMLENALSVFEPTENIQMEALYNMILRERRRLKKIEFYEDHHRDGLRYAIGLADQRTYGRIAKKVVHGINKKYFRAPNSKEIDIKALFIELNGIDLSATIGLRKKMSVAYIYRDIKIRISNSFLASMIAAATGADDLSIKPPRITKKGGKARKKFEVSKTKITHEKQSSSTRYNRTKRFQDTGNNSNDFTHDFSKNSRMVTYKPGRGNNIILSSVTKQKDTEQY